MFYKKYPFNMNKALIARPGLRLFQAGLFIIVIVVFSSIFFRGTARANPVRNKSQAAPALSNGANNIFSKANRQYEDGNFNEAAGIYEQLISRGVISGNIYYNLGNAYYKTGRIGKALINYERAKKLIPDNEDLFANISFIKSALDVQQPEDSRPAYKKIWIGVRNSVSVKVWFFVSVILLFSVCLIRGFGFLNYGFWKRSRAISVFLVFMFIISLVFFINSYNTGRNFKSGIIITRDRRASCRERG